MSVDLPSVDAPAKKSKRKTKADNSIASKLSMEQTLCLRLAKGENLDESDFGHFVKIGWNRAQVERGQRDVVGLLATVKEAGTLENLESKKEQLATSRVEGVAKLDDIDAEIKRLMDNRDEISFNLRGQTEAIETQERAIESLRGRVPKKVKDMHSHLVSALKMSEMNRQRLDLESKVGFLEGLKRIQTYSLEKHDQIAAVIGNQKDLPDGVQDDRGRVHLAKWEAYVAKRLMELPEAVSELKKMEDEFQSRLTEIDSALDYWIV